MNSNKLLSEVIGYKVIDSSDADSDNDIGYTLDDSTYAYININELAHKCKEWASKDGYAIIEYPFATELYNEKLVLRCCKITDKTTILYCPSRVFKACQWVLDNKELS